MFSLKFYLKECWLTFLCSGMMIAGSIVFAYVVVRGQSKHIEEMKNAPCETFGNKTIENIPARCIPYFRDTPLSPLK